MIAAGSVQDLTRGLGRNAFDMPVAALAGFAAAVIAFAIPADLLGQLVSATGLPHLLAAAEPPLGLKARGAIGIAGAAAAFGLVFLLLRMLDRRGRARPAAPREAEDDPSRPRLRRRDGHPDAPVCRPISAARDFGEPAPPARKAKAHEAAPPPGPAEAQEAPALELTEAQLAPEPEPAPQPEPPAPEPIERQEAHAPAPEPAEREARPAWFVDDEAEPDAALAEAFAPDLETVRAALWEQAEAELAAEPVQVWDREPVIEPAPVHEPEPEPTTAFEPEPEPVPACEPAPKPEPQIEPLADASLPELMRRLEQGLARRRDRRTFAVRPPAHAPAPQVFPEANDDRLQSAIESLQRFAARGD
jgi:hypothetical protein